MAMNELENSGEINVKLSMHSLDKQEATGSITICQQKAVCFVLDPLKESKRKKVGGWEKWNFDNKYISTMFLETKGFYPVPVIATPSLRPMLPLQPLVPSLPLPSFEFRRM